MKYISLTLSICIIIPLLSGCWDRVEVNDIAIITAAAIDYTEDNQIKVSVQIFIPRALPSGGMGGGTGESTFVREATGVNLADAISKLQMKIPRKIFWGQCRIFIFGMQMAEKGIQEQLDYLIRHPQPRGRAYMFVSKDNVEKVLETIPPLERYSGEVLRELSDLQVGLRVTMQDLDLILSSEAQAAALPLVEILPPPEGKKESETIPFITGTAVFKKDKLIGVVDVYKTRGIIWLRNEIKQYTISFKPKNEKGEIALNPVRADVKLIPKIANGQWKMTVKTMTEGDVVQNGTKLNMMDPKVIQRLEEDYQKDIQDRIKLSLKDLQEDLNADIIGFATEFHRKYPKEWKKVKDHWDDVFPQVEVKVDVEAYIRRPGYISSPSGLPKEEVKKE
jgi:spore germination protein KC